MVSKYFRPEPSCYEEILNQWAKFSYKSCNKIYIPNCLESGEDGNLWLLHRVRDVDEAILCNDGKAVRILKLGFSNVNNVTIH